MRTLSAAPSVFLDADSSADSSASKRISLSIPFSRPICSITAISSLFMPLQRSVLQAAAGPGHLRVETRLRDGRPRHFDPRAVPLEGQLLLTDLSQTPAHFLSAGEPAADLL